MVKEWLEKHYRLMVLIGIFSLCGVTAAFGIVSRFIPEEVKEISKEVIGEVIGEVVDRKLNPINAKLDNIQSSLNKKDSYAVALMESELNACDTPDELNARIDYWITEKWRSQTTAMKMIARNNDFKAELKPLIIEEDIYKEFLRRLTNMY